jgi:eukaryotic-like serine/threonine-protein kinase
MVTRGDVLGGRYVIERILGQGGMGLVVAARHVELGQRVAIKMLLASEHPDREILRRFERESRSVAELSSEHVARVTDIGTFEDGSPFMVMEYLEGEDLSARIERAGPLPVGDVLRMFIQACIGLGDAHEHGIVHRDIKPSNLFLSARRGGRVVLKVLDFGIAKATLMASDHQLTRTSAMMGSPQYMSPEQLRDTKNVDARTDVWSLGATMYEALTGSPAFPADTLAELHVKILTEEPAPTCRLRPEVPSELDAIVLRCLRKQPEERFASMDQLQHVLEGAEHSLASPRVAVQSDQSLSDTLLPKTAEDLAFSATGVGEHSAAVRASDTRDEATSGSDGSGVRSMPPQVASGAPTFVSPALVGTRSPISQTMGGVVESAEVRSPSGSRRAAIGGALAVAAFVAMKLVAAPGTSSRESAPPASASASALPAKPAPAPHAEPSEAPAPPPAPAVATSVPATAPVAASVARAEEPAQEGADKAAKGSKRKASKAVTPAEPAAAPAPPKAKKKSALEPEID